MLKAPTGELHSLVGLIRDNWHTAERQRHRVSPTRRDTRAVTRSSMTMRRRDRGSTTCDPIYRHFLLDDATAGQAPIGLCQSTTARARSAWRFNSNLVS
jgi:hypothetical protein